MNFPTPTPSPTPTPAPTPTVYHVLGVWFNLYQLAAVVVVVAALIILYLAKRKGYLKKRGPMKATPAEGTETLEDLGDKILVRIKDTPRDEEVLIKPTYTSDGLKTFVIEEPSEGRAGWTFTAKPDAIGTDSHGRPYVEVFRGSTEAITFDMGIKSSEQPHWNKDQSKKFITFEALKRRYQKLEESTNALKKYLILAIILVVICLAISIYLAWAVNNIHITIPAAKAIS